ncbi:uncharacterized protein BYT42DRAFT_556251 [Radiomyces spectabilis]|uniref:uncharacterized protein n=1 Tax=Radiomyces spectabilis TaxID=64574 RepID=UPI00221E7EB6|nr:uncharacterized protein BYT42DRAFT_556251 [Radiomyces spectabilis]KAI8391272.1 hypothetical protein BYT42DRAFT_556251 [Radiomyces spectabilis]
MAPLAISVEPDVWLEYPDTDEENNLDHVKEDGEVHCTKENDCPHKLLSVEEKADEELDLTKEAIMRVLKAVMTVEKPQPKDMILYDKAIQTSVDLQKFFECHLPKYKVPSSSIISSWMAKDIQFGRAEHIRVLDDHDSSKISRIYGREIYVKKEVYIKSEIKKIFNRQEFLRKLREENNWVNIGYARKSHTNDSFASRIRNLQKMVNSLHIDCLCSQVFVSPHSNISSSLETRDCRMTNTGTKAKDALRFVSGDFQDMTMAIASSTNKVRLIIQTYRGLTSNPVDLQHFVRRLSVLEEICIDIGYHMVTITREEVLDGSGAKQFQAPKGPQRRSTLHDKSPGNSKVLIHN